jgi:hypothetical protein
MTNTNMGFMTVKDTVWLYPMLDIRRALDSTAITHTFDGTNIVCPDLPTMRSLYAEIFAATAVSQPVGNTGFSLGVGTLLEELHDTIYWKTESGHTVIIWKLVKQITPQSQLPSSGSSPVNTVGYMTTFTSFTPRPDPVFDAPYVVRI